MISFFARTFRRGAFIELVLFLTKSIKSKFSLVNCSFDSFNDRGGIEFEPLRTLWYNFMICFYGKLTQLFSFFFYILGSAVQSFAYPRTSLDEAGAMKKVSIFFSGPELAFR